MVKLWYQGSQRVVLPNSIGRAASTALGSCGITGIRTHEHMVAKKVLEDTMLFFWACQIPALLTHVLRTGLTVEHMAWF